MLQRDVIFLIFKYQLVFFLLKNFFDTGFLTAETSEVVDSCSADCTFLVHLDAVNHRVSDREDSLNTDVVRNLSHGESCTLALTCALVETERPPLRPAVL